MRVAIIGHFGGKHVFLDGQTVKTLTLYHTLRERTDWKLVKVDTYLKNRHPVRLLIISLFALITCSHAIILLSGNGRKFYYPLLSFFKRFFHKHIWHDVIGGDLKQEFLEKEYSQKALPIFDANWVETDAMKNDLEALGLKNCMVLPNFKNINALRSDEIVTQFDEPLKLCTFSRVMAEKGITAAIEAVESYNRSIGRKRFILDIYGAIDDGYRAELEALLAESQNVTYSGCVEQNQSVPVLKDYYALLFPTYWWGEGMPGTIVDAFSAAVPVIATDYAHNAEFIIPMKTGLLYPSDRFHTLADCLQYIDSNSQEWMAMRPACLEASRKWDIDRCSKQIISAIEGSTL